MTWTLSVVAILGEDSYLAEQALAGPGEGDLLAPDVEELDAGVALE